MAISWGSTVGNFRLGVERSGRTWRVYGQSVRYGHNWSYTLSFSGSTGGSVSGRFVSGHNETKTVLLHSWTMPAKTSYSFTARLTSVLVGGATVTGRYTYTPPSPKPNPPGKPGKPSISRSSDTQHAVSWSGSGTWTGAQVQRQTNSGSAQTVASPGGNPRSWTDKTTKGNSRYRWRVRGKNAGGWGSWSDWSNWAYTTPGKPGKPTVAKTSNGDIRVTGAGLPAWASSYDVQDDGTQVGTSVGLPWIHANPNALVSHKYRVRGKRASGTSNSSTLVGGWSDYSAVVQLAAPPAAPTDLVPNGVAVDAAEAVRFEWVHNPVDSSEQTAFQVDYREPGGSWTSVTGGANEFVEVGLAAGEFEWRVRTKGVHASWGDWSAIATVSVIDQPGAAIDQPAYDSTVDYSTLNVEWTYFQGQDAPQSGWEVELLDADGDVLESRDGVDGATSVVLATRLVDGESYTVRVRVASSGLWSDWDESTFAAEFTPPIPGTLDGAWNDDEGAVDLVVGFTEQPTPAEHRNYAPRIRGTGEPLEIRRNLSKNPAFESKRMMLDLDEDMSMGSAASLELDSSWSVAGGLSAKLSGGNGPNTSLYVIGTADTKKNLIGDLAGETLTVAATCRLVEPQVSPVTGGNDVARSIMIGYVGANNVTHWDYAVSDAAPNAAGEYRLAVTFTLPDLPASPWFIRLFQGDASNTTAIWWDAVTIELGETDGSYFDGFTDEIGVTAKWEDEPYLSESFLEVEPVEGFVGVGCTPVLAEWEGRPAIKLLPDGENGGYAYFDIPADARAEGTFMATLGLVDDLTAGLAPFVESPAQSVDDLPVEAGTHEARLHYEALTGTYRACLPVGETPVVWSRLGLYEDIYEGVQWDGDTSWVEIDGERLFAKWVEDGVGSITGAPGNPVLVTVERNMGDRWVTIYESDEIGESFMSDFEALSNGVNEYRITTWSELGATSEELFYIPADSGSVWLSGGDGFSTVCRLPYNPQPARNTGRATSLREYSGRSKPVVYKGKQLSRVVDIAGDVLYEDDETASYEELEELVHLPDELHLYRDPDGQRMYGALSEVSLSRQSHVHWSYSASITEADR